MSKSGSRYGRRSNWFKIHCLLQEQQQQQQQQHQQQQQQKACNNNNNNSNGNSASYCNNNNNTNATINSTSNENSSNSTGSPGLSISNGFLPSSFLSNLCNNNNNNNNNSSMTNNNNNNSIQKNNNNIKKNLKRSSTPSDSGASSADPDEGGGGGGGGDSGSTYKEHLLAGGILEDGLKSPEHADISLPKLPAKISRTPPSSSALQSLAETYRPVLLDRMSPYLPAVSFRADGAPYFPVAFSIPPVSLALLSSGHAGVQLCKRDEQSEPIDLSVKSKSSSRSSSESPQRIHDSSPLLLDPSGADNQSASTTLVAKTTGFCQTQPPKMQPSGTVAMSYCVCMKAWHHNVNLILVPV
uniref:Protein embryonic gonad n=1 Tax=Anopheles dirus TaxID=7168 RepID=A0A182NDL6_9DIPT